MRRIILVASFLAVIELAGSSFLERLEQRSVKTIKNCVPLGSNLEYELGESYDKVLTSCEIPDNDDDHDWGKYIVYDSRFDFIKCNFPKYTPEICLTAVQDFGLVWDKIWDKISDPTVCEDYEFWNIFIRSCN